MIAAPVVLFMLWSLLQVKEKKKKKRENPQRATWLPVTEVNIPKTGLRPILSLKTLKPKHHGHGIHQSLANHLDRTPPHTPADALESTKAKMYFTYRQAHDPRQ